MERRRPRPLLRRTAATAPPVLEEAVCQDTRKRYLGLLALHQKADRRQLIVLSNRAKMSLLIQEVPASDAPMDLLLLADPLSDRIRSYLPGAKCFVVSNGEVVVGACVVQPRGAGTYEIMNIVV